MRLYIEALLGFIESVERTSPVSFAEDSEPIVCGIFVRHGQHSASTIALRLAKDVLDRQKNATIGPDDNDQ